MNATLDSRSRPDSPATRPYAKPVIEQSLNHSRPPPASAILDVNPRELTPKLIDTYLNLKRRNLL